MASKPSAPVAPQPTPEEQRQQQEAEQAAIEARERARIEKLQAQDTQKRETWALSAGLRGRRSLLSMAGETGFPTGLSGT